MNVQEAQQILSHATDNVAEIIGQLHEIQEFAENNAAYIAEQLGDDNENSQLLAKAADSAENTLSAMTQGQVEMETLLETLSAIE